MKKKEQNKPIFLKIGIISIILIFLDQITKFFFTSKTFLSSFYFYISYSENRGSAFGLFSNIEIYNLTIIIFSILILILLFLNVKFFLKNQFYIYCFILLISGIIGNLIDRIFFGYVRDFIVLEYLFIFNLADAFLSLSLIYFFLFEYEEYKEHRKISNKK